MKHILTCSFGKDSIATALLALQHGEPLDELVYSEVMFSDTVSGELPEHKRFIYETAIPYFEKRGIPTRVLRGQKTYLDCFYHIVSRGNAEGKLASFPLTGRCSIQRDCKLPPIRTYQKTLPQDTVYYLGIAADEPIRLARLKANQTSLLAKYNLTEKDAQAMCQAEGLLSPAICVHRAWRLLVLPQCVHVGTSAPVQRPPRFVAAAAGIAGCPQ